MAPRCCGKYYLVVKSRPANALEKSSSVDKDALRIKEMQAELTLLVGILNFQSFLRAGRTGESS
jgi:tRNA U38,U39,U40 pseudouridine synthase TruA